MASTQLTYLRGVSRQLIEKQRTYNKARRKIADDPFMDPAIKAQRLKKLASEHAASIAETRNLVSENAAAIKKKVVSQVEIPESARLQLHRALTIPGVDLIKLAHYYVEKKNRAGLAALAEQLEMEVKLGKGNEKELPQTLKMLQEMERPLLEPAELAALQESEEVDACIQYLQANIEKVGNFLQGEQRAAEQGGFTRRSAAPETLYGWFGLNEQNRIDPIQLLVSEEGVPA